MYAYPYGWHAPERHVVDNGCRLRRLMERFFPLIFVFLFVCVCVCPCGWHATEASAGQRMQAVAPDGTPFAFMVHTHTHNTHTHTHITHTHHSCTHEHTHTHTTRQSTDESSCPVLILVLPSSYQLNLMLNKPLVPTKPRSCSSLFSSFIHNPGS